jgi:hypothetical protein
MIPHSYAHGAFLLLYDTLSNSKKFVDSAIYNLSVSVFQATNPAMTCSKYKNSTFISGMVH